MARSAAENDVDFLAPEPGKTTDLATTDVGNTGAYSLAVRKIELVGCTMNRVDFNCCGHIEPSLFKTEGQTASTRKKIDANRS